MLAAEINRLAHETDLWQNHNPTGVAHELQKQSRRTACSIWRLHLEWMEIPEYRAEYNKIRRIDIEAEARALNSIVEKQLTAVWPNL